MNLKMAKRVRKVFDQEGTYHCIHALGDDHYEIYWCRLDEGDNAQVTDSGILTRDTKIMDLPFGEE